MQTKLQKRVTFHWVCALCVCTAQCFHHISNQSCVKQAAGVTVTNGGFRLLIERFAFINNHMIKYHHMTKHFPVRSAAALNCLILFSKKVRKDINTNNTVTLAWRTGRFWLTAV